MKREEKFKLKQIIVASLLLSIFVLLYNFVVMLYGGSFNSLMLMTTFILDGFTFGFITFSLTSVLGKLEFGNNLQTWFAIIFGTAIYLVSYSVLQANVSLFILVGLGLMRIAMISLALFMTGKIIKK